MTIVGLVGYKICSNAIQLYQFCYDWNIICESRRIDLTSLHFFQQNYITRNIQIMKSLTTTTFFVDVNRKDQKQQQQQQQLSTISHKSLVVIIKIFEGKSGGTFFNRMRYVCQQQATIVEK